jgi:hypothetical protein
MQNLKIKVKFLTVAGLFTLLTACGGGGSSDTQNSEISEVTIDRSLIERTFEFEEVVQDIYTYKYDQYIYEFTTKQATELNLNVFSSVYARYYNDDDNIFNIVNLSPSFYILDDFGNVIADLTLNYSRDPVTSNITLEEPGIYYILVSLPLFSQSGQPLRALSADDDYSYGFKALNQITDSMIMGTQEDDTLRGYNSDQYIYGQGGSDTIYGQDGNDFINGGLGNDLINGGMGVDSLTGETGNDIFIYTNILESPANILSRDTIEDFTPGEDFIDLSAIVYEDNPPIRFTATSFYNGQPPANGRGVLWFTDEVLYGKLIGTGVWEGMTPDFSIALPGITNLAAEDIIFTN